MIPCRILFCRVVVAFACDDVGHDCSGSLRGIQGLFGTIYIEHLLFVVAWVVYEICAVQYL